MNQEDSITQPAQPTPEATDEEVEHYLSERGSVDPAPELEPEAVIRLKERIAQVRQPA
jgi:hypothetical protein